MRRFRPAKPTPYKPFENDEAAAYIYLLTNKAFPYVKIGYTEKSPKERAKELSSVTGVPTEFQVKHDWFVPKDQVRNIEAAIHGKLKRLGYHHRKEFFDISTANAKAVIEDVLREHDLLDLALTKEEERLEALHRYYDEKKEKERQRQLESAKRVRDQQIEAVINDFRRLFLAHLGSLHGFRTLDLPVILGGLFFLIALAILELVANKINLLLMLVISWFVGGLVYVMLADRGRDFVRARYERIIQEQSNAVKQYLEDTAVHIETFITSGRYRQFMRVNREMAHHPTSYRLGQLVSRILRRLR